MIKVLTGNITDIHKAAELQKRGRINAYTHTALLWMQRYKEVEKSNQEDKATKMLICLGKAKQNLSNLIKENPPDIEDWKALKKLCETRIKKICSTTLQ